VSDLRVLLQVEEIREDRLAAEGGKGQRADELSGTAGHGNLHRCARLHQETEKLDALVRRNATGYPEDDPPSSERLIDSAFHGDCGN
jgi:hypothetical protein